jgi:hypothetical protein
VGLVAIEMNEEILSSKLDFFTGKPFLNTGNMTSAKEKVKVSLFVTQGALIKNLDFENPTRSDSADFLDNLE